MPIRDVQTTNKQHAVPQNIMDVEFKIIGELTLRQFAYLMVFCGIAYISAVYMQGLFKWPVVVISALLGVGLAFVPLQERGLDQWIVNFFLAIYTPNQKIWKKDVIAPAVFLYQSLAVVKQELITLAPTSSRRKLEDFLEHSELEKKEDRLDIPEKKYIQMVRDAYANIGTGVAVSVSAPAVSKPSFSSEVKARVPQFFQSTVPQKEPEIVTIAKTETVKVPPVNAVSTAPFLPIVVEKPVVVTPPMQQPPSFPEQPALKFPGKRESDMTMMPITPDRHSGRKFTNLLPRQGELILPIRGEKMLKTNEETNIDKDIKEKTDQLNQLINQIKGSDNYKPIPAKTPPPQIPVKEQQKAPAAPAPKHYEARLEVKPVLQPAPQPAKLFEKKLEIPPVKVSTPVLSTGETPKDVPSYTSKIPSANKPNVVLGVVLDSQASELVDVVVIVRNDRNETIRAVKTNSIGLFTFVSPLANGLYKIIVDEFHKSGSFFDIISVQAKGEIIPPLELRGRL